MFEKIIIGIAVIAFLVLSYFSPLHIIVCGAVIIAAATCAYVLRGERYQEEVEQLLRAKISLILFTYNGATIPHSTNTTVLIESIKEIGDAPYIYSSCAEAIFNMDTMRMVEEALQRDLTDQQRENLQKLLQAIQELYKSILVINSPVDGDIDLSDFILETIGKESVPLGEIGKVAIRLNPAEKTKLIAENCKIRFFNPEKDDLDGSIQEQLNKS